MRGREILDHHVLPVMGRAQLVELNRETVPDFVSALAARWAPSSVRRTYTVLYQLLGFGVDEGLLQLRPAGCGSPACAAARPAP